MCEHRTVHTSLCSRQSLDPNSPRVDVNSREIHRALLPYLTLVEHACYLHTRQPPHCHQTRAAPLLPASNEASQFIRFYLVLKGRWHLTYILRSCPGLTRHPTFHFRRITLHAISKPTLRQNRADPNCTRYDCISK